MSPVTGSTLPGERKGSAGGLTAAGRVTTVDPAGVEREGKLQRLRL